MADIAFHSILFISLLSCIFSSLHVHGITYNTHASIVAGKINVHLVPHTHDDVGWLKTIDQYFVGSNNTIQNAAVGYILDSVISSLKKNPDRKFIYAEQAFFQRWWRQQSKSRQTLVKKLVKVGQLEFINGGWCMHDEATTHYIDMIDQTTLGHSYIKKQFDIVPRIGWQIDPFGHSAVQAYLLGAELGFDGLFFARIDYQDRAQRYKDKSLEVIWQGSKSLGSDSQIFTSVFPVHYGPPEGFLYEEDYEIPLQDDPSLFDVNIQERVDSFIAAAQTQANLTRTNHVMWTMGNDFKYETSDRWFSQMDKLIHYVNQDGRVNALYSTPSIYLRAKFDANETWPLKTGDFFPYADNEHSYWTGYFSSRPGLKRYVRVLSGYLQLARQLEFLIGKNNKGPNTHSLWDALSVAQHHDAVSGTEKQHVADDYTKRLAIGSAEAGEVINSALDCLTSGRLVCPDSSPKVVPEYSQCPLLNISYCPASELELLEGQELVITAYNGLGWAREEFIRIPVNSRNLTVQDALGKEVPSQLVPLSNVTKRLREFYLQANLGISTEKSPSYWLVFKVVVPPLGFNSYFVSASAKGTAEMSTTQSLQETGTIELGPGDFTLSFSAASGQLIRMANKKAGIDIPVYQSFNWYEVYTGAGQNAGAYIFRPAKTTPEAISQTVPLSIHRGSLFDEVHQAFSPWTHQVFRLYKDTEHVEIEFMIGPIPIDDGIGKEVITRFETSIASNKTFYTDSNGRDFLKRVRNYRPDWNLQVAQPVAGNYYPVNLGTYLKDDKTDFSVLVDRPVGAGSITDGQIEILLHRRLLKDDSRGVDEALNEVVCLSAEDKCEGLTVLGRSYVAVNRLNKAPRWRRSQGQKILFPLQLAFKIKDKKTRLQRDSFSTLADGYALPDNVALITLQELDHGQVLLRLAHLYERDEDPELSTVATVDLKQLFAHRKLVNGTELTLSGNQEKVKMNRLKWRTMDQQGMPSQRGGPFKDFVVELGPMEIRTFHLEFA